MTEVGGKKETFFGCMSLEMVAHIIGKLLGLYADHRQYLQVLSFFRREMGRTSDIFSSQVLTSSPFCEKIPVIIVTEVLGLSFYQ